MEVDLLASIPVEMGVVMGVLHKHHCQYWWTKMRCLDCSLTRRHFGSFSLRGVKVAVPCVVLEDLERPSMVYQTSILLSLHLRPLIAEVPSYQKQQLVWIMHGVVRYLFQLNIGYGNKHETPLEYDQVIQCDSPLLTICSN